MIGVLIVHLNLTTMQQHNLRIHSLYTYKVQQVNKRLKIMQWKPQRRVRKVPKFARSFLLHVRQCTSPVFHRLPYWAPPPGIYCLSIPNVIAHDRVSQTFPFQFAYSSNQRLEVHGNGLGTRLSRQGFHILLVRKKIT